MTTVYSFNCKFKFCCYLLSSIWKLIQILASLFVGHAAQKSKLHNLQYDEGGNHMTEAETEAEVSLDCSFLIAPLVFSNIYLVQQYVVLISFFFEAVKPTE